MSRGIVFYSEKYVIHFSLVKIYYAFFSVAMVVLYLIGLELILSGIETMFLANLTGRWYSYVNNWWEIWEKGLCTMVGKTSKACIADSGMVSLVERWHFAPPYMTWLPYRALSNTRIYIGCGCCCECNQKVKNFLPKLFRVFGIDIRWHNHLGAPTLDSCM